MHLKNHHLLGKMITQPGEAHEHQQPPPTVKFMMAIFRIHLIES